MKPSIIIAVIFLLLVSIKHLLQLIFQVKVRAGAVAIPIWMIVLACIVTAALAIWLWLGNKK